MPAPAGTRCLERAHTVGAALVWPCSLLHCVVVPVVSFVVEHRPVSRGGVQPQSGDWTLPEVAMPPGRRCRVVTRYWSDWNGRPAPVGAAAPRWRSSGTPSG